MAAVKPGNASGKAFALARAHWDAVVHILRLLVAEVEPGKPGDPDPVVVDDTLQLKPSVHQTASSWKRLPRQKYWPAYLSQVLAQGVMTAPMDGANALHTAAVLLHSQAVGPLAVLLAKRIEREHGLDPHSADHHRDGWLVTLWCQLWAIANMPVLCNIRDYPNGALDRDSVIDRAARQQVIPVAMSAHMQAFAGDTSVLNPAALAAREAVLSHIKLPSVRSAVARAMDAAAQSACHAFGSCGASANLRAISRALDSLCEVLDPEEYMDRYS